VLKQFLYYLLEEDGRSNTVVNGIVTSKGQPTPLVNTPDGWQGILIAWERNQGKHGIQRNFSPELSFINDGAKIIRDSYYKQNIDRKLFLLIQQLGLQYTSTFKWLYSYLYKGELDFSTIKDNQDTVQISIMEGGLSKLVNANLGTIYNIPFDDDDFIFIKMDGINLFEGARYNVIDGIEIDSNFYGHNWFAPFSMISRESTLPYFAFLDQALQNIDGVTWADKLASDNFCLKANDNNAAAISVHITGKIKYTCTENDIGFGFGIRFIRSNQLEVNENDYVLFVEVPVDGQSYEHDVDLTIPLQPGERLYLEGVYSAGGGGPINVKILFNPESDIRFDYNQRGATTYVKAFLRKHLFKKLVYKLAGSEEYAVSSLLDADDRAIISGDSNRGVEHAAIKTTLAEFYADVDADRCTGMGIDNNGAATANLPAGQRLTIEAREDYYDDSDPIDLGEAKDLQVGCATDFIASSVKAGWKEPNIEDVNGKYDFNASHQYTTPVKRISREYGIISPYKAGCFEIELNRINLAGKDTTDNNRDNENYVLQVERSQANVSVEASFIADLSKMIIPDSVEVVVGQRIRVTGSASNDGEWNIDAVTHVTANNTYEIIISGVNAVQDESSVTVLIEFIRGILYKLKRETYDNEGDPEDFGVPDPTSIFNVDLSPKRMLKRHGRWIRSMLSGYDSGTITFQSGTKNVELKTVQGSVTVREKADVAVGSLGAKIFTPFTFSLSANSPVNLAEIMEANPNRCFKFTWDGVEYKGFNLKAGFAPNILGQQEYNLLSTADNDLTQLIH
jgi:hypothetical protein